MQILVVVANIQAGSLRTEAEKGFARTAIGRESTDPKSEINFEEGTIGAFSASRGVGGAVGAVPVRRKGSRSKIRRLDPGFKVEARATSETSAGRPGRVFFSY